MPVFSHTYGHSIGLWLLSFLVSWLILRRNKNPVAARAVAIKKPFVVRDKRSR